MTLQQIIQQLHGNIKSIESMSEDELVGHLSKYFKVTRPTEEQISNSRREKTKNKTVEKQKNTQDELRKIAEQLGYDLPKMN